jgi:hypothetical protein
VSKNRNFKESFMFVSALDLYMGYKRKATADPENLTGGTGDVNPQTYTIYQTINAAPFNSLAVTSTGFPLPVPKFPSTDTTAIVMEFLEINWRDTDYTLPYTAVASGIGVLEYDTILTTNPTQPATLLIALQDPRTISHFKAQYAGYGAAAANAPFLFISNLVESDREDVLNDGAGHGLLVATPTIYLYTYSSNVNVALAAFPTYGANAQNITCVISYRMKTVGVLEYVGIVQSQQ